MKTPAFLLLASLAFALIAGCTGYPPEAARMGDTVTLRLDVRDLATGQTLVRLDEAKVTLGNDPFGYDLDHALYGKRAGSSVAVESHSDAGRTFTSLLSTPRLLEQFNATQDVPREVLPLEESAKAGDVVALPSGDGVRIVEISETTVRVKYLIPEDPVIPYPDFGVALHILDDGPTISVVVEVLDRAPRFAGPLPGFLDAPGDYQAIGRSGGNVTFATWTPGQGPTGGLAFEGTVLGVERGTEPAGPAHPGPQLVRDPRRLLPSS